jgi:hypothetical protein
MSDKKKKRKSSLKLEGGGSRQKGTIGGGGRATARVPIGDNVTFEPYVQGWAAQGPWGDDGDVTGYGGTLTYEFKEGGMVIVDRQYLKGK